MYLLAIVLLLGWAPLGRPNSLTFIMKQEKGRVEPTCLAEDQDRYSGLGWTYPIPDTKDNFPQILTRYIPEYLDEFKCQFGKNHDCNLLWKMPDWTIDELSDRTFGYFDDSRWEDLPEELTSKTAGDYSLEVPHRFKVGISIRTDQDVEVFVCNGWNPKTYPCYKIAIGNNSTQLSTVEGTMETKLNASYVSFTKILSKDEWRSFILTVNDDKLQLVDYNMNRTVLEHQSDTKYQPMYLIVRSELPALWKIHHKSYLYTTTMGIYRFGSPKLLESKNLCIALYVALCPDCVLTFFMQTGGKKKVLQTVQNLKAGEWQLIKIKQENVLQSASTLFVHANFTKPAQKLGFWAIDSIRICDENEVKISHFIGSSNTINEQASCMLVNKPNWRPKKMVYQNITKFELVETSTTKSSIHLKWLDEDPHNHLSYFISYNAEDLCDRPPHNEDRMKSKGFLITKHNEIVLDNLVPYTNYTIVISSILHSKNRQLQLQTKADDSIQITEFPQVKMQAGKNRIYAAWDPVDCASKFGPVFYEILVKNDQLKYAKTIKSTNESFIVDGLKPMTEYELTIKMGRKLDDLNTVVLEQSFTTFPDVAPTVQNLELYAVGKHTAFLRYDLPSETHGQPASIKVDRCLSLSKCKPVFFNITNCPPWPLKHCIKVDNLMEYQQYTLKISMRNYNTPNYGKDTAVNVYTMDKVPGAPSNITSEFVDCKKEAHFCNLNVSWLHPYNQNSTITGFNVILLDLDLSNNQNNKIYEKYPIVNDSYKAEYTHQIKFIPYGARYEILVQAENDQLESDVAKLQIKTDDLAEHIEQGPKIYGHDDTSVTFKLAEFDKRLDYYNLLVYAQDFDKDEGPNVRKFGAAVVDNLCHKIGHTWLAKNITVNSNGPETVTIGATWESEKNQSNINAEQKQLAPNTKYCFTFVLYNKYRNTIHNATYYETAVTLEQAKIAPKAASSGTHSHLYLLLLFVLVVPIALAVYWYVKRRRNSMIQLRDSPDNVYESLPFEDGPETSIENPTYDKLLHK